MKHVLTTAAMLAATTLTGASALAADLPARKLEPVVAAPMFTWTGFYVGVNAGVGFGGGDVSGFQPFVSNAPGIVSAEGGQWRVGNATAALSIGGQIGYNMQLSSRFVGGIETDLQYFNRSRNAGANASYNSIFWGVPSTAGVALRDSNSWFGSLRARLGVTPFNPNFMIYATGGLAYGRVGHALSYLRADNVPPVWTIAGASAVSSTRMGWTAGAGVEWAGLFSPNLSLKVEWLYTDLGATTQTDMHPIVLAGPAGLFAITQNRTQNDFHTVRAGVNYRFNWGAAPVVARY